MKKFLVALCVMSLCLCSPALAEDNQEITVGVLRFQSSTVDVLSDQAAIVGDVFTQRLAMSENMNVLGQSELNSAADEAKISMSGYVSNKNAAKIGQIAGCKYIIAGTVTNLKMKSSSSGVAFIGSFGSHKAEATAAADIRVIDVETGEVMESFSESSKASQSGSHVGIAGFGSGQSDINGMQQAAISNLATKMSLKTRNILGDPATVKTAGAKEVTLNIGTMGGAGEGVMFRIYTGSGKAERNLAVVKVKSAQTEQATAVIADKNSGNLSLVRKGDNIALIDADELKSLQKGKKFAKSRPKESSSASDLEELMSSTKSKKSKRTTK